MRFVVTAIVCLVVAAVAYVVRGDDYINDYKNGGVHDWLAVGIIYVALIGFVAFCGLALVQVMRGIVRRSRRRRSGSGAQRSPRGMTR